MLLESKNAVVYGAGGAMGRAVASAFAREGAHVVLTGRTETKLATTAKDIISAGGTAETTQLDALDRDAVESHLDEVVRAAGSVDISFNAIDFDDVQGQPLVDMSLEDFLTPVAKAARTHFITATAAARHMSTQGSGVILMLSSSAARESGAQMQMGGFSLACAAIECLTRSLAGEVGRHGVRVVALRPNLTPETRPEQPLGELPFVAHLADGTALGRLPHLAEVANTAAFVASEHAGAMTGAVVNLTCGAIVD